MIKYHSWVGTKTSLKVHQYYKRTLRLLVGGGFYSRLMKGHRNHHILSIVKYSWFIHLEDPICSFKRCSNSVSITVVNKSSSAWQIVSLIYIWKDGWRNTNKKHFILHSKRVAELSSISISSFQRENGLRFSRYKLAHFWSWTKMYQKPHVKHMITNWIRGWVVFLLFSLTKWNCSCNMYYMKDRCLYILISNDYFVLTWKRRCSNNDIIDPL